MAEEAGLRAGPDRGQAGLKPEATGLEAGPERALGRAGTRASRPQGWPRPVPRPGTVACGTATTGGDGGQRREREREREEEQGGEELTLE